MSQQTINIGTIADDGTGDPLRTAGGKINANFTELYADVATRLVKSNNLSDLTSAATARTSLGLGTAAVLAATAILLVANNLSDLASPATARTNLGLATIAASGSASDLSVGTLPAGRFPALTGDVTTVAGALAATLATAQPGAHTWAAAQTFNAAVVVNLNAAVAPTPVTGTGLQVVGADAVIGRVEVDSFGAIAAFTARRANGTGAVPTALLSGDQIGGFNFYGYFVTGGPGYGGSAGSMQGFAAQNWTSTNQGTRIVIATTPNNSTTLTTAVTVDQDQSLAIAGTTASTSSTTGALKVSGGVGIAGNLYVGGATVGLPTGNVINWATGNVTLTHSAGKLLFNQNTATSMIFAFEALAGTTNGGTILSINAGITTGTAIGIKISGSSTSLLSNEIEQNGNGSAAYRATAVGTGDAYIFTGSPTQNWTTGMDQSDSSAFKIAAASSPSGAPVYIKITTTGIVSLPAGVASTSTTTGTLVVTGGVGVSGALFTGGNVNVPLGAAILISNAAITSGLQLIGQAGDGIVGTLGAGEQLVLRTAAVARVRLADTAMSPNTTDAVALGTTALMWSDLFLAAGAVINFNAGNYTLTHSAGALAASGLFSSTASLLAHSGTAIPAGGTAGAGLRFSSTANYGVFFGSGAPSLSAAKGSIYLRSDGGGTNDRAYINTDGGTTWTALVTVA